MANSKLVSVIMPVYNPDPGYLDVAISSVVTQQGIDLRDMELVMVDDFSDLVYRAATEEIVNRFRARYPNLSIIYEQNRHEKGIGNARNTAIEKSRGKFAAILDYDDALVPNAMEISCSEMEKSDQALVAFSDHIRTDEALNPIYERRKQDPFILHCLHKNTVKDPLLHMTFTGHLQLYRRDALIGVGGYNDYRIGEDLNLLLRLSHLSPEINFLHIPKPLYLYRSNPNGITSKRDETIRSDEEMLFQTLIELGHDVSAIKFFDEVKPQYNFYDLFDENGDLVDVPWLDRERKSIIPHQEIPRAETPPPLTVQPIRAYAIG
jgi:glycosyltransferase involved in cell wall biosynthesis